MSVVCVAGADLSARKAQRVGKMQDTVVLFVFFSARVDF